MADRLRPSIVAILALAAALVLVPPIVRAGAPSCLGDDACTGNIGAVIGERACRNNPGPIPPGTCVGPPRGMPLKGVCEM